MPLFSVGSAAEGFVLFASGFAHPLVSVFTFTAVAVAAFFVLLVSVCIAGPVIAVPLSVCPTDLLGSPHALGARLTDALFCPALRSLPPRLTAKDDGDDAVRRLSREEDDARG